VSGKLELFKSTVRGVAVKEIGGRREDCWVFGVAVNCPLATAEAIVHEMARHKLRAFGVANENAIRIISKRRALSQSGPQRHPRPAGAQCLADGEGLRDVGQHARTDAPGREFLGAFFAWCSDVLASRRKLLASERC
jgi:hypothetical protein